MPWSAQVADVCHALSASGIGFHIDGDLAEVTARLLAKLHTSVGHVGDAGALLLIDTLPCYACRCLPSLASHTVAAVGRLVAEPRKPRPLTSLLSLIPPQATQSVAFT